MPAFLKKIQNTARDHALWSRGSRMIAAVSGGPDSMCLLDVLARLAPKYAWTLRIAHVNYGLRGLDARDDEQSVREAAARYDIPFDVLHPTVPKGANLEARLRDIRYAFFEDLRRQYRFDRIAVAHNRNDQAETLLLHLLRGSGTNGLQAMRIANDSLIRPLLETSREAILQYLEDCKIAFRTDRSNIDERFLRNKVRHTLIPFLEREFNPSIVATLAETATILGEEYVLLQDSVDTASIALHHDQKKRTLAFASSAVRKLPVARQKHFLRHALALLRGDLREIESAHLREMLKILRSDKSKVRTLSFADVRIICRGDQTTLCIA
jgi:tRNA(Ile)-lysidine synthase